MYLIYISPINNVKKFGGFIPLSLGQLGSSLQTEAKSLQTKTLQPEILKDTFSKNSNYNIINKKERKITVIVLAVSQ